MNRYFEKLGRAVVYIEHNIKSSHVQLQVVPIPITKVDRLEKKFKVTADFYISIIKNCDIKLVIN